MSSCYTTLLSSHCAGWLLRCLSTRCPPCCLFILLYQPFHCLVMPAGCDTISHPPLIVLPSHPLIMPCWLMCCLSLCPPLVLSLCWPSLPHHHLAVVRQRCHQTPSNTATTIEHRHHHHHFHCCHISRPSPPSNTNGHLCPSPSSNSDAGCRRPPPLVSITIFA